jgi:hypothetical protein
MVKRVEFILHLRCFGLAAGLKEYNTRCRRLSYLRLLAFLGTSQLTQLTQSIQGQIGRAEQVCPMGKRVGELR